MSKASCVSWLLYEDTGSLRSRLLYGNCCGNGSCSYGHNCCGDDNYGCGWGISSLTTYNSEKFNSEFWTIVSSTPLRLSLSCSYDKIKRVWPWWNEIRTWYNNWTIVSVAWVGRQLLIFLINCVNVIDQFTYRNIGFAHEYIDPWTESSAIWPWW